MRSLLVTLVAFLLAATVQVAVAQSFSGVFYSPSDGNPVQITIMQDGSGQLSGDVNGNLVLQGEAQGAFASGVMYNQEFMYGFTAQLSADGQQLELTLYQDQGNGNPTPIAQEVLNRIGDAGAPAGGMMPIAPGQAPGAPGQMPGAPGQMPGSPGQMPTVPGQMPGAPGAPTAPGMPGAPGQMPPMPTAPGQMPGAPGQAPGVPGQMPTMPPAPGIPGQAGGFDWSGQFVGDAGRVVMSLQGAQGNYMGNLTYQGQQYQFQAHLDGPELLHAQGMSAGGQFEFWAEAGESGVWLELGNELYQLQRQ